MDVRLRYKDQAGRRYWLAEWTERTPDGRTRRRSASLGVVGEDQREAAEAALRDFTRTITTVTRAPTGSTARDAAERYYAAVARSLRPSTMVIYRTWIGRFVALYGDMPVQSITPAEIEAYAARLREYEPSTTNIALRSLRTWLAWLVERGEIPASPFRGIRMAAARPRSFPPYVTREQLDTVIIPAAGTDRLRAAIALAFYCGLRRGECAALRWTDVDVVRGEIRVESREDWQTKSGRSRTVPLLAPVRRALDALPRIGSYVLSAAPAIRLQHTPQDAMPDDHAISRAWHRLIRRITHSHPDIPPITFHGLRHSCATWMAAAGVPLRTLQHVMGHASITTTMIYAHVQPDAAMDQVRAAAGEMATGICPAKTPTSDGRANPKRGRRTLPRT